ncbi:MAG TPA: TetR/AcrR family transcriptional regulator [Streptosporangiaceae bacterium]|jgi:AcrR family transcriptional regulator
MSVREVHGKRRRAPTRAERQARTRTELLDAAERLFTSYGFHATFIEVVADEAGYTKGAVYGNFASKEDLFFAVYERRVERLTPEVEQAFIDAPGTAEALLSVVSAHSRRREENDDGWLAVFLEFWTHVLRHPEHRDRFAAIHNRYVDLFAAAISRLAEERGVTLPFDARRLAVAMTILVTGLGLERLTQPGLIGAGFGIEMQQLWLGYLTEDAAANGRE